MNNFFQLDEFRVREVYDERASFSKLYTDKGELLVLLYKGKDNYGWSSWHHNIVLGYLWIHELSNFFYERYFDNQLLDTKPMDDFLKSIGMPNVNLKGLSHLKIELVPKRQYFRIVSMLRGDEAIHYFDGSSWYLS